MEKKVLDEKTIERKISDVVAIWGIEGMDFSEKDLEKKKAFLRGELSKEEFLSAKNKRG